MATLTHSNGELVTWEYYSSHFPKLNEQSFDNLKYRAEREVKRNIIKRIYTEDELCDIKDCICEVINALDLHEFNNGKSSVSNDGYSEAYIVKTIEEKEASIKSIIEKWVGYMIPKFISF